MDEIKQNVHIIQEKIDENKEAITSGDYLIITDHLHKIYKGKESFTPKEFSPVAIMIAIIGVCAMSLLFRTLIVEYNCLPYDLHTIRTNNITYYQAKIIIQRNEESDLIDIWKTWCYNTDEACINKMDMRPLSGAICKVKFHYVNVPLNFDNSQF
jgi:hypothetical protein